MENRPNILIFMTDQQRGDTILPGSPYKAITPNVDRFRQEGVTFTRAYCPSPHCCPSRATFFSGLYPSQHGVWNNVEVGNALSRGLNEGITLWSEDLKQAGYRMDFSGKWHVSAEESPSDRGWDHASGGRKRPSPDARKPVTYEWNHYRKLASAPAETERKEAEIVRPGYSTYTHYGITDNPFNDRQTADAALETIRSRTADEGPWCQFVGTLGPHDPYKVPQRFLDLYDPKDIPLPAAFHDRMADKPALYRRTRDRFAQLTEHEHREALRHYLALCSYEDALFGEVLEALEQTGQADNTLVIYLSDHGDYTGEHGLWCKGLPCFNSAYHVPLVIRWPKGVAGPSRQIDAMVSLADITPTLLDAAAVRTDRTFAGASLLPWLRGESPASWRDAVFTQSNGNELYGIQRSVMTDSWKYVYNGFDYDELYDLRNDPHQQHNVIDNKEYAEVVRQLSKRLWRFAHEHDDVCINPYIMVALAPYGPGVAFSEEP